MRAKLWVYTQRKGLLARVGHDLKIYTDAVRVDRDGAQLRATVDAASLMVVCAMRGDTPDPKRLTDRDRAEIHRSLHHTILDVDRHPQITFDGAASADGLAGTLRIRGTARPVLLAWVAQDTHWTASTHLDHRDFGIPAFSALMGTLRVDPRVRVEVRLPDLRL